MLMRSYMSLDSSSVEYTLQLEKFNQRYLRIPALTVFYMTLEVKHADRLVKRVVKQFTSYKKALDEVDRLCEAYDMFEV